MSQHTPTASAAATATPAPTDTSEPTALGTPDNRGGNSFGFNCAPSTADAYWTAVAHDICAIGPIFTTEETKCGAAPLADAPGCRAAAASLKTAADAATADIGTQTASTPGEQTADPLLKGAFADFSRGAGEITKGIDASDPAQIAQGNIDVVTGAAQFAQAASSFGT